MKTYSLTAGEAKDIDLFLADVMNHYQTLEDPRLLNDLAFLAQELPRDLRRFFNDFKQSEPSWGVCMVRGLPVSSETIGPTPGDWRDRPPGSPLDREELYFALCGSALGHLFGWQNEQGGRLVQDVAPIKAHEGRQMSTGSQQIITWHTEEAFHPYRPDYLGLMCMRNDDQVATTFATVEEVETDQPIYDVLFEPRFVFETVESHQVGGEDAGLNESGLNPVLYGDRSSPYLRIDPYFMSPQDGDSEAAQALETLIGQIDGLLRREALSPGDCCFIDNFKVVHGRDAFAARYDGTDRWLKRLYLTCDLRKSRHRWAESRARVLR